jgi:hypothetical protein
MTMRWLATGIVLFGMGTQLPPAIGAPPAPAATQPDPASDRLTFLTLQLSSAEESIKAINAALRAAGYKAAVAADKIEIAQKGNELMDRKGGAPVPWDQFYGKTARSFLAPAPRGDVAIMHKGPGETLNPFNDPIKRPKQFDYLYRANAEQAAKAAHEVAAMGRKIDTLLARRRQLEAEQVALWTKISLEALGNRGMAFRHLYRFKLKAAPEAKDVSPAQLEALGAAVLLVRQADKSSAQALDDVAQNPEKALGDLSSSVQKSVTALQESAADVLAKGTLNQADAQKVKDLTALGRRMQSMCKNIADARRLAGESDIAADEARKLTFRAQLQESLLDFSDAVAELDTQLTALAESWKIQGDPAARAEAINLPATAGAPATATPAVPPVSPPSVTSTDSIHTGNFAAPRTPFKPARKIFAASETSPGNLVLTAAGGPYEIADMLTHSEGVKRWDVKIEAGAEVRGGTIDLFSQGGRFEIAGDARHPAVIRGVTFICGFRSGLKANYAVFEDCKFLRGGKLYNNDGYTSKWEFENCHLTRCVFPKLNYADYGFKFTDCTFLEMAWPAIVHPPAKDQPQELMVFLRKGWNVIERCQFESCSITPLVYWCAQSSNFDKCKFEPGPAFESDTETQSIAYVTQTEGDVPDKAFTASSPKRATIHMTYADKPFPVFAFPPAESRSPGKP